jgi:hypothetical protein
MNEQPRTPNPTPLEIAAACVEIRRNWSEIEHRRRSAASPRGHVAAGRADRWRPPTINFTQDGSVVAP